MKNRQARRHQRERLKAKRKHYYCECFKNDPKHLGIIIDTPSVCSCSMCGNPRKYFKKVTIQELKEDIEEKEQLKEDLPG